ncbi:ORF32 [Silurid herpesvirus 1]|nr:ORF32 [Silurid herpesvirus 1]
MERSSVKSSKESSLYNIMRGAMMVASTNTSVLIIRWVAEWSSPGPSRFLPSVFHVSSLLTFAQLIG